MRGMADVRVRMRTLESHTGSRSGSARLMARIGGAVFVTRECNPSAMKPWEGNYWKSPVVMVFGGVAGYSR
jgi:hypothetical protein